MKGSTKGSTNKATRPTTHQVDSSSSEEGESSSEGGNSVQGGILAKTGDDGNNGDEKDVLVMLDEMQGRAVEVEKFDRSVLHTDLVAV